MKELPNRDGKGNSTSQEATRPTVEPTSNFTDSSVTAKINVNELADDRAEILYRFFPRQAVDDYLFGKE